MLRYSIADEMLYGSVGDETISTKAFSGGGRGSTAGKARTDLAHWSSNKKAPDKYDEENRGGPLPVGLYIAEYIGKYKTFGECARLHQTLSSLLQADITAPCGMKVTDRDGFLIHGTGKRGSDGCIVPASEAALIKVMSALKKYGKPIPLEVHSAGVRFDKIEARRSVDNIA
jgi:hypothetical protein